MHTCMFTVSLIYIILTFIFTHISRKQGVYCGQIRFIHWTMFQFYFFNRGLNSLTPLTSHNLHNAMILNPWDVFLPLYFPRKCPEITYRSLIVASAIGVSVRSPWIALSVLYQQIPIRVGINSFVAGEKVVLDSDGPDRPLIVTIGAPTIGVLMRSTQLDDSWISTTGRVRNTGSSKTGYR